MGYGKIGSGWRGFRAGVGGLFGGAYAGGKAFMTNDKKVPGSVFSAMQKEMRLEEVVLLGWVELGIMLKICFWVLLL